MEIYRAILIILLFFQTNLLAENYFGYTLPYYNRGIGGTPSGLGGAFVAIANDGNVCFYNPAGLVSLKKQLINLNYQSSFIGGENLLFLSYAHTLNPKRGIGFYFIWSGIGNLQIINEDQITSGSYNVSHYQLGISYGYRILPPIDIGITGKLFYYNIWQYSANSIDFDFGIKTSLFKNFNFGLLLQNFVPITYQLRNQGKEDLPLTVHTGISYAFIKFLLTYEIEKTILTPMDATPLIHHIGFRYSPFNFLALNFGYDLNNFYVGLNLKLEHIDFFSGTIRSAQAGNFNFSLAYEFKQQPQADIEMEDFYQGVVHYQNKDYRSAMKYFQKVLDKRNDPTAEYYLRNCESFLESEEWMSEEEKTLIGMRMELAKKQIASQEYGKAISTLRDVLTINPENEEADTMLKNIKNQVSENVNTYYREAESLFKLNKYKESLDKCNIALGLDPEHKPSLELKKENEKILGDVLSKEQLAQQQKEEAEALFNAGLESFKNGNWTDAINNFDKSYKLIANPQVKDYLDKANNQLMMAKQDEKNKKESEVHLKLGIDLLNKNKLKDAIKEFETAVNLSPNNSEGQKYLTTAREKYDNMINLPLENGKAALREGKLSEAIKNFNTVLSIDPENEVAKQFLSKSKGLVQDSIKLNLKLGDEQFKNNNFATALGHYREALNLDANNSSAKEGVKKSLAKLDSMIKDSFNKGVEHYNNKRYQAAMNEFESILKLDVEYAPAIQWLDKTKSIFEQNKTALMIEEYMQTGMEQFQNKNFQQAKSYFLKALEIDKNYQPAKDNIQKCDVELTKLNKQEEIAKIITDGLIQYRRKKFDDAISIWEKAKMKDPENKIIDEYIDFAQKAKEESLNKYYNDGETFFNEGNLIKAKDNLEKAIQVNPNHSKAKQKLAQVKSAIFEKITFSKKEGLKYFKNGEYDNAIEEFKTVLSFEPENDEISDYVQICEKIQNFSDEGQQLMKDKKYADALEKFNSILEYNKSDSKAQLMQKQAIAEGQKLSSQWFNEGLAFYKQGELKKAYVRFSSVTKADPSNTEAQSMLEKLEKEIDDNVQKYYSTGLTHYEQGNYKNAIDEFNKIINLKGNFKDTNLLLTKASKIYNQKMAKEQAMSEEKVQGLLHNGIKFYRDGKLKEAIEEWEKVLKIYPDNQKAQKYISRAKYKLSQLEKLE